MIELRSSQPSVDTLQRVMRLMMDVKLLDELSGPQVLAVYGHLEATRDLLNRLLDRADGKSD